MSQVTLAVWSEMLGHLRRLHPELVQGWFTQLEPGSLDHGEFTVSANHPQHLQYLAQRCTRVFAEAAQLSVGRLVSVRFRLSDTAGAIEEEPILHATPPSSILNEQYVFDRFITGPCNRLAHAACVAVSDTPGTTYNPLFLHGCAGLGKTHLLQAVCNRVLDTERASRVLYLTCEAFTNDFLAAVQRGALNQFQYRYRHVDVLVIDDIQFLASRERSQEEFFHTFNALHQTQKQIILSADSSPSEIPSLEDRLVSRFSWGLVVQLDRPELETRMAIVRSKAESRGLDLDDEVTLLIASKADSNIRQLEGAINKVASMAQLTDRPINLALAREALGEHAPPREISIEDILDAVIRRYGVRLTDLQSKRRSRSIAMPRQVCMYLARQLTRHSLEEVGGYFGGRDHTTVLHAERTIRQLCQDDPTIQAAVQEITDSLNTRQPATGEWR